MAGKHLNLPITCPRDKLVLRSIFMSSSSLRYPSRSVTQYFLLDPRLHPRYVYDHPDPFTVLPLPTNVSQQSFYSIQPKSPSTESPNSSKRPNSSTASPPSNNKQNLQATPPLLSKISSTTPHTSITPPSASEAPVSLGQAPSKVPCQVLVLLRRVQV